jgi:hypothetical protein
VVGERSAPLGGRRAESSSTQKSYFKKNDLNWR